MATWIYDIKKEQNLSWCNNIHGIWLQHVSILYSHLTNHFNQTFQQALIDHYLTTQWIFLKIKYKTKDTTPDHFNLITCVLIAFKLLIGIIACNIYKHLISNYVASKQKRNFKNFKGINDRGFFFIHKTIV